jgi:hypothetical protein
MTGIARTLAVALVGAIVLLALGTVGASAAGSKGGVKLEQVRAELREASAALDRIWGDESDDSEDFEDEDEFTDDVDDELGDDLDELGEDLDELDVDALDETEDVIDEFEDESSETIELAAIAANLQHTANARQLAAKVRPRKNRPAALIAVFTQADENVYEYADGIGWVEPSDQTTFVEALRTSLALRDGLIRSLLAAAPKQDASPRVKSLKAISGALTDGDAEILLDTLAEEDGYGATREVKQTVVPVLADLITGTDRVAADLRKLGTALRSQERRTAKDIAGSVAGEVEDLPRYVEGLFRDFADYDDPDAAAAEFCGYLAGLPLPVASACG